MEVKTKSLGTVQVDESKIIKFPNGLLGFEDYHNFAILECEYKPFLWMQSLEEPGLAFLIVDPFIIADTYELDVDDKTLAEIEIETAGDVIVFAIVTVPADGGPVTANLQGPVVINKHNNQAMQVILSDSRWTTKFNIVKALKSKGAK
ncbi:MAG: flagellar assembly protein FliW [Treponema sp.]|nr:flagellar assembly protein FliW [Candidatus Treponema equifaecale]